MNIENKNTENKECDYGTKAQLKPPMIKPTKIQLISAKKTKIKKQQEDSTRKETTKGQEQITTFFGKQTLETKKQQQQIIEITTIRSPALAKNKIKFPNIQIMKKNYIYFN